jgi:hypothetical protein
MTWKTLVAPFAITFLGTAWTLGRVVRAILWLVSEATKLVIVAPFVTVGWLVGASVALVRFIMAATVEGYQSGVKLL